MQFEANVHKKGSSQHKYAVKTRTVVSNMALSVSSGILRYHLLIAFFLSLPRVSANLTDWALSQPSRTSVSNL